MRKDSMSSGKVYGYARTTTPKQKTRTQSDRILKIYPDAVIYADLFRQGIQIRILDEPLLNSKIYADALTGSTGSAEDILINAAASQIILSHTLAIDKAKKTGDRIRDGLKESQAKGNHIGRPRGVKTYADSKKAIASKQKIWELSKDFQGTLSDPELIDQLGIARNTFYKYKKHLSLYGPELTDNRRKRK